MANQTVAQHLVRIMIEAGVRNVYGIVGDSANPVIDAIRASGDKLRFLHVRNEEAGAFAAGADAQVSGRPAAVIGSSGPGALHLVNGLYDCMRNEAPVFAIASHVPSTEMYTRYFQETRPDQIYVDCTAYLATVTTPKQMPRLAELAMQAAILERGVGMLIVPGDLNAAEVDEPMVPHPVATRRPVVRPADADIEQLVALIQGARKIAIYGGAGCAGARPQVLELAHKLVAPVAYTFRGKDVLEADNPQGVGMTGLLGWGAATLALHECELLLMLGTDFPYHAFLPDHVKIVQIDDRALHLGRRARVDLGLVGDVGATLDALLPHLAQREDRGFLDAMLKAHAKAVENLSVYVKSPPAGALRPEAVATALSDAAAPDAVFTADTGMCNVWSARYLRMKPGQRMLGSFGHGSMANAMPQAMGAAMAAPGRQVIALCGDGGFGMLMGELLTIAAFKLPVKLMIFNNSTLGMVRAEQEVAGYEPWGTDVPHVDYAAIARAAGLPAERVERTEDIAAAVQRALATPGPALVDFVTDPRALAMPPSVTVEQLRGYALAMGKVVLHGDSVEMLETVRSNLRDLKTLLP